LPIDGADLLLVDDVLYTGRTIRAVLNELYDYGRPARVRWRCWSTAAAASCRSRRAWPPRKHHAGATQRLRLRADDGRFSWRSKGPLMLSRRNPQLNAHGELIHLLSIEGLPRAVLTQILDTAGTFVSASASAT
jgi:hypothetical protein